MIGYYFSVMIAVLSAGGLTPRCDLLEINHYAPDEKVQFVQAIAWDWSPDYRRFHCQDWSMVKSWHRSGDKVILVLDDSTRRVLVHCKLFRETWTKHDPERENQALFPVGQRRDVW